MSDVIDIYMTRRSRLLLPYERVAPQIRTSPHIDEKQHNEMSVQEIIADGHTELNPPDLFRPPKLSSSGPG